MKRYTVAHARQHLADVLDQAEHGEAVVIERRGIRFLVTAQVEKRKPSRRAPSIEILDPAIEDGTWSWSWNGKGAVVFRKCG